VFAVGAGPGGGPQVNVYDGSGALLRSFLAYDPRFTGGVRVASADVNGDGVRDVITAPGPGGGPDIRVWDGKTGVLFRESLAYDATFTGGVFVAAADLDGDGKAEVITGAGPGSAPDVRIFRGTDGSFLRGIAPYDATFRGSVSVAAGDVNGDGKADIITGAGPGGGPHVKVFDGATGAMLSQFFAYDPAFTGGVSVAAGDVDGDGKADIITGAGAGGAPHVRAFSGLTGAPLASFLAYDPGFRGGVTVGAADLDGDGRAEILTGAGPGGGSHVKAFDTTGAARQSFLAFDPGFLGGVFVG
jgi:hypothetical protein